MRLVFGIVVFFFFFFFFFFIIMLTFIRGDKHTVLFGAALVFVPPPHTFGVDIYRGNFDIQFRKPMSSARLTG